jgi:hypothetical protein
VIPEAELRALPDPLQLQFRRLEHKIVARIANHIARIGTVRAGDLHALNEMRQVGFNLRHIEADIAATLATSQTAVRSTLVSASVREYGTPATYHAFNVHPPPFSKNTQLQQLIAQIARGTDRTFQNISHSSVVGLVNRRGQWQPLAQFYRETVDFAILQSSLGTETWQRATLQAVREMSDGGIRSVSFMSGHTLRVDSAVRRHILGGLSNLSRQQAELIADQIDADGMEITWHDGYRPSHDWGGQQFPLNKYYSDIRPQMEEPNCYHRAFAIVLGVSTPAYTDEELAQLRAHNQRAITFEGEVFTQYTAEQRQRRFEASIREAQDRVNAYTALERPRAVRREETRARQLITEYRRFSDGVGLPTPYHRIAVPPAGGSVTTPPVRGRTA